MKIDYLSLLKLFTRSDDFQNWMNVPFRIGDNVYATDAHVFIIVPGNLVPEITEGPDYSPDNILRVIPKYEGQINSYRLSDIKSAIANVPLVEGKSECQECDGYGEVEFEYTSIKGNTFEKNCECPICEGDGVIRSKSGKKEIDSSKRIQIGLCQFDPNKLNILAQACEILNSDTIGLYHQPKVESTNVFKVGEVDIIIMPCRVDEENEVVATVLNKEEQ